MALADLAQLAEMQAQQAQFFGNDASQLADPYGYKRRQKASDDLDLLLKNPGAIESSPFFKYLAERAMNEVKASNAARGFTNSGRGLLALQEAAQGSATKAFFPLAELYGKISGATNPFSPAAAGLALSGYNRSQDYRAEAAAAKSLAERQKQQPTSAGPPFGSNAWYEMYVNRPSSGGAGGGASSSTGLPYSGAGYDGAYTPSQGAGTGYLMNDEGSFAAAFNRGSAPSIYSGAPSLASFQTGTNYDYSPSDFEYSGEAEY